MLAPNVSNFELSLVAETLDSLSVDIHTVEFQNRDRGHVVLFLVPTEIPPGAYSRRVWWCGKWCLLLGVPTPLLIAIPPYRWIREVVAQEPDARYIFIESQFTRGALYRLAPFEVAV